MTHDPAHAHITHRDGTVFQVLVYEDRPTYEDRPAFEDQPIYALQPIYGTEKTYFASGKLKSAKRVIIGHREVVTGSQRVEIGTERVQTGAERVVTGWDEAATAAAYQAYEEQVSKDLAAAEESKPTLVRVIDRLLSGRPGGYRAPP
jgi:hypothetical protein